MRAVSSWIAACALAAALAAGCTESATSPSGQSPFTQTDVRTGTGNPAITNSLVTVHYTGWLYDQSKPDSKGLMFETSTGGTPFTFSLGNRQVIEGWDQGVTGMRVGGLRRLVIPPSLAYGSSRNGPIPPNATLVFDIELLEVR